MMGMIFFDEETPLYHAGDEREDHVDHVDHVDRIAERAAIMEFDGALAREEAESLARLDYEQRGIDCR